MAYCELRSVTIEATRGDKAGRVDFSLSGDGVTGERIACDKNQGMSKEDPHLFVFQLKAEPSLKLRFLKDPDSVMQIVSEGGVANQSHSNKALGFDVVSVTDDVLVVSNLNDKKCDFKFTLNFVATAGGSAQIIPYDPIWGNGNGGNSR